MGNLYHNHMQDIGDSDLQYILMQQYIDIALHSSKKSSNTLIEQSETALLEYIRIFICHSDFLELMYSYLI